MCITIQNVVDLILSAIPETTIEDTVDTFKTGNPQEEVTGIVTTFIVTRAVIEKAIDMGANFIITHEPTFFDHQDKAEWIKEDPVYKAKRELLDSHGIAVWRFHDYWHSFKPDGILTGMIKQFGWQAFQDTDIDYLFNMPPKTTVADLIKRMKSVLSMPTIRMVGELAMPCHKVGLIMGAVPGDVQIRAFKEFAADVLICGETTEWQTCEYVREANAFGFKKALIILGHEKSEEGGMAYLAEWLQPQLKVVPILHVPAGDPILFV